jgi:hypothetical protein
MKLWRGLRQQDPHQRFGPAGGVAQPDRNGTRATPATTASAPAAATGKRRRTALDGVAAGTATPLIVACGRAGRRGGDDRNQARSERLTLRVLDVRVGRPASVSRHAVVAVPLLHPWKGSSDSLTARIHALDTPVVPRRTRSRAAPFARKQESPDLAG